MSEPCHKCNAMKVSIFELAADLSDRDDALARVAALVDEFDHEAANQMDHAAHLARLGTSESVRPHVRCLARAQVYTNTAGELRAALEIKP